MAQHDAMLTFSPMQQMLLSPDSLPGCVKSCGWRFCGGSMQAKPFPHNRKHTQALKWA